MDIDRQTLARWMKQAWMLKGLYDLQLAEMHAHWAGLTRFLNDGRLEPDTPVSPRVSA